MRFEQFRERRFLDWITGIIKPRGPRVTVRDPEWELQVRGKHLQPELLERRPLRPPEQQLLQLRAQLAHRHLRQPGRASGNWPNPMACGDVSGGAISDGLKRRCDCLPQRDPRCLVALVVDPGYDYHWYRKQRSGFWGHKPGGTAARNTDNSGVLITDPEACDRGGYTDFCGYFYAGRSVVIT